LLGKIFREVEKSEEEGFKIPVSIVDNDLKINTSKYPNKELTTNNNTI
jgi:hypothetical protein